MRELTVVLSLKDHIDLIATWRRTAPLSQHGQDSTDSQLHVGGPVINLRLCEGRLEASRKPRQMSEARIAGLYVLGGSQAEHKYPRVCHKAHPRFINYQPQRTDRWRIKWVAVMYAKLRARLPFPEYSCHLLMEAMCEVEFEIHQIRAFNFPENVNLRGEAKVR